MSIAHGQMRYAGSTLWLMSLIPLIPDLTRTLRHFRDGPISDLCTAAQHYHFEQVLRDSFPRNQVMNSTAAVSKLYIAPAILMAPLLSNPASTGLFFRMSFTVIRTFVRATASTKA